MYSLSAEKDYLIIKVVTLIKIIALISVLVVFVACQNVDSSAESDVYHSINEYCDSGNDQAINAQEDRPFYIYQVRHNITNNLGDDVCVYTIAIGSYPFNIFGGNPLFDEEFAEINRILFESAVEWVREGTINPNPEWITSHDGPRMPYVVLSSNRYISTVTRYLLGSERRFCWFIHAVNINMETNSIMTLDDIIYINDDFIRHLQQGDFWESTHNLLNNDEASIRANEFFANLTMEEAGSFFESMSVDPLQIILETGSLLGSNTFYLEPGRISMIYHGDWVVPMHFIINIDDIEEFLRIPKW